MNEYNIEEQKKGIGKIVKLGIILVIVAGLVMVIYYFTKVNQPASSESQESAFTVAKGSTTKQIANSLKQEKIISNPWVFLIFAKLNGVGNKIQAGEYVLNANMTVAEIVDVLTRGQVVSRAHKVTLIEGQTNQQIGKYLASRNIVSETDFEQSLANKFNTRYSAEALKYNYQGFLFPDTYTIAKSATSDDIVDMMLKNFDAKVNLSLVGKLSDNLGPTIILASIIEKEVGRNKSTITAEDLNLMQKERELVASVFYNRIEIGMALESDATVNYITGKKTRSVTIDDTKIQSPYNTYANRGLPPGPISNPGLGSIKAAIYPAQSDYLYFLNAPDGTAYFAKTLAEHSENRAKYLR